MTGASSPTGSGSGPPNTASELVNTNLGGAARRRQRSSSSRVASRLTRIPRSKSASAWPLTTAARWNTLSVSAVKRAVDHRRVGKIADDGAHARIAEIRRRDDVEQHDLADGPRPAAGVGQRVAGEDRPGKAGAEEAGAAGDQDAHGRMPFAGERFR